MTTTAEKIAVMQKEHRTMKTSIIVNGIPHNIIDHKYADNGWTDVFIDSPDHRGIKCSRHSIPAQCLESLRTTTFTTNGNKYTVLGD